jgi:hypothetical protein
MQAARLAVHKGLLAALVPEDRDRTRVAMAVLCTLQIAPPPSIETRLLILPCLKQSSRQPGP